MAPRRSSPRAVLLFVAFISSATCVLGELGPDTRTDCPQIVEAQNGCHVYDVLAACPQSCLEWLSKLDHATLNPEARKVGPRRLPPGSPGFERILELASTHTTDATEECKSWARKGECEKNAPYMNVNCARSCSQRVAVSIAMSEPQNVVDKHEECATWGAEGECVSNPLSMLTWCAETCTRVAETTVASHSREL